MVYNNIVKNWRLILTMIDNSGIIKAAGGIFKIGHNNDNNSKITVSVPTTNNSKFSGKFTQCDLNIYITKVLYNNPYVITFWSDGTKTMAKAHPEDTYNREFGLTLCILKKLTPKNNIGDIFADWIPEDGNNRTVMLKDVRKLHRKG